MEKFKSYWLIIFIFLLSIACREDERVTAFKNVNLVPMTGEKIVEGQTVLVKGDRILKIGSSNQTNISRNTKVIDCRGAYLMPGLADMHVHLRKDWPISQLDMYLVHGVTTIRDLGGKDFMRQWREEVKLGKRSGPTIYVAAPIVYGYEKNAPNLLPERIPGYDCIKLYSYFSKEDFHEAMQKAKKLDLYTVGHIPFAVGLNDVISEGMDEIAHIEELIFEFMDFDRTRILQPKEWLPFIIENALQQNIIPSDFDISKLNSAQRKRFTTVIDKLKSTNIAVCTTMVIDDVIVQKLFTPQKFRARPDHKFLPPVYKQAFLDGKEKHQVQFKGIEKLAPFKYDLDKMLLVELHRAGIPLVLGTDAGTGAMGIVPGVSLHDELSILVENGFTPYEAIKTSTVNASKVVAAMTGRNDFGTIEVGKRADFILVNKNPLEDIAHFRDNRGVMAGGQWYESAYLKGIVSPAIIPGIPFAGIIKNVHEPDNTSRTYVELVMLDKSKNNLPDAIETITVTGPQGELPIGRKDFT
ncbi:MAG: amidohydrolase family protein, partial [Desulfobacterales bacterium]|nr:amidohydrolase family protein [Desulfobacterales bacterium]